MTYLGQSTLAAPSLWFLHHEGDCPIAPRDVLVAVTEDGCDVCPSPVTEYLP